MLKEIYNINREDIDKTIKNAIKKVKNKMYIIKDEKNKELIDKIEENYNIKINAVAQELYIKGLKDGINLMCECKCKNP